MWDISLQDPIPTLLCMPLIGCNTVHTSRYTKTLFKDTNKPPHWPKQLKTSHPNLFEAIEVIKTYGNTTIDVLIHIFYLMVN